MKKITIMVLLALVAASGIVSPVSATSSVNDVADPAATPSGRFCAQVITNAVSSSGECKEFPTPCQVPKDWTVVSNCSAGVTAPIIDIKNRLQQMRASLKDFTDKKKAEETDKALSLKEKVASKKKAIEARVAEAKKTKEEKRKTVLLNLIDIQIKQFGNTKERVAKMPNIKAELKTDLNAKIDAAITELNAEKAKVQAAATPEELKNLAKDIKDLFKAKRDIVKQIVNAILASRVDKNITAAENRLTEIKNKTAELKANGKDVLSLESLLASAEAKLSAAKAAGTKEELKNTVDGLKDVYKDLRNAIAKLNGTSVSTPAPTTTPVATPAE